MCIRDSSAAWLGMKFGIAWLASLDAVAALGVAGVIIWVGSRLGKRTLDALLDVAPHGLREDITRAVNETEGVLDTERVRVRRAGQRYFVLSLIHIFEFHRDRNLLRLILLVAVIVRVYDALANGHPDLMHVLVAETSRLRHAHHNVLGKVDAFQQRFQRDHEALGLGNHSGSKESHLPGQVIRTIAL